jgi:hypothetical protein
MSAPTGGPVPEDEAARQPALQQLDAFVGEWIMEAPFAPGVTGRAVFEWVLGGQFLVERSEVPFSTDGRTISGCWETSRDGSIWEHDFDLTYRKVM